MQGNLIGKRFERLVVLSMSDERKKRQIIWNCICDCGTTTLVSTHKLNNGHTKSCGCFRKDATRERSFKHGKTRNDYIGTYRSWTSAKDRCSNPENPAYKYYGGRGIKMCERWVNSFEDFLLDMGKRPSLNHTLDRYPDNDGNYEMNNCRWATNKEQSRNKRNNTWIEFEGNKMILQDWSMRLGIGVNTLLYQVESKGNYQDAILYFKKKKIILEV